VVCGLLALAVLLPAAAFSSLLVLPWCILAMLHDHGFATSGWQRHIGSRLRGCAAVKLLEGVHAQLVSRSVVAFLLKLLKPCSRRVDGLASRVVVSRLKRELL